MRVPAAIATNPAGMPRYLTPPNQLSKMIAKQMMPISGVVNIWTAGAIEIKVI